jgi:hypothetical protein
MVVARNTVEHTIQEVQVRRPVNIRIEPGERGGTIRNLQIFEDGSYLADTRDLSGREGSGPEVTYRMEIHLLPVKVSDRRRANETVCPPAEHLGATIQPHVFLVAGKAFEYYNEFFRLACEEFLEIQAT